MQFEKKFKSGDIVCLISDVSKKYTVDKYYFQHPVVKEYNIDDKGKSHPIENIGHETQFVLCVDQENNLTKKIHQDKLMLITTF